MTRATLLALVAIAAAARADVTQLFPDRTAYVVRLNVNAVLAQPTALGDAKSLEAALGDAATVMKSCGVEFTRDVARATLAVGADASARTAVLLIEGKFDPAKVNAQFAAMAAEKKGGVEARPNGVYRWTLPPDKSQPAVALPRNLFVAMLDGQTAAVAIDEGAIDDAIDKKAGRKRSEPSKAVHELLAKADPRQAVNFVAVPPPNVVANTRAAALTHVVGGLTATDALKLDVTCATTDAPAAKSMADYIDNAVATYKDLVMVMAAQSKSVTPQQLAMLREFFGTFRVASTPTGVTLSSVLSKEFLEKNSK